MSPEFVIGFGRQAIELCLMMALPMLGVGLAVGVLISSLAAIIAFIAAFAFSGPVSEGIYDKFIRGKVDAAVSENLGTAFDREMITGLSKVDMNK